MNRFLLLCALPVFLLSPQVSVSTADESSFRFVREVQTGNVEQEELVLVPLDSDAFAGSNAGFTDLWLQNQDGQSVPFLLQRSMKQGQTTTRQFWKPERISVQAISDQVLEIRVTLQENDARPDGLKLVTPLQNYEHQVQVWTALPGQEDRLLADSVIFDYSQFMDVSHSELKLPQTDAREFLIRVDALTSDQQFELSELTRTLRAGTETERTERMLIQRRPFRIDRIEFWKENVRQQSVRSMTRDWPVTSFAVSESPAEQQTVISVTTRREPLTGIRLLTDSRNFSRRVRVQVPTGSGGQRAWSEAAAGTVSSLQLRNLSQQQLMLTFPEMRHEEFRLVISNHASPPLQISGVEVFGSSYEVAFLAVPEMKYSLLYGAIVTTAQQHDTAAVQEALRQHIPAVVAVLGDERQLSDVTAPPRMDLKRLLNHPVILSAIIGILILVLGWGLYQAAHRIEAMPSAEATPTAAAKPAADFKPSADRDRTAEDCPPDSGP